MAKNSNDPSGYTKDQKITKVLGAGRDGYQTGGINITKKVPNIAQSQTVKVKGTRAMLANKSKTATWF